MGSAQADVVVHIQRPLEEVFDFMSHYDRNVQWQEGVLESRQVTGGEPRKGIEVTYTRTVMGRSLQARSTMVAFEPNAKMRMQSSVGPADYLGGYDFRAEGGGTRVHFRGEITTKGRLMGVLGKLLARNFESQMRSDLQRLKALLESGGAPG